MKTVLSCFCAVVALLTFSICAASAESAPTLDVDLSRAAAVQQSIQQRFWDPHRQRYISQANHDNPAEMWAAGIAFSALNGAVRYEPSTYRPILLRYFHSLDQYWDRNEPIPGYEPLPTNGSGHDKYYDDNAWMAIAFVEAYDQTGDTRLLARARQTTDFVLSGWDDQLGGGIWWHERHKGNSKNTCANAPAAVAALALAARLPNSLAAHYRIAARNIVSWTRSHLQNPDGRYADHVSATTGEVARFALTYNTALMIRANLMLARQTNSLADEQEAEREARAADAFVRPGGAYSDATKWSHLLVEADFDVARQTTDAALATHLRQRARAAVNADYAAWQSHPSENLIDVAALARELWLVVDDESPVGRLFWKHYDAQGAAPTR